MMDGAFELGEILPTKGWTLGWSIQKWIRQQIRDPVMIKYFLYIGFNKKKSWIRSVVRLHTNVHWDHNVINMVDTIFSDSIGNIKKQTLLIGVALEHWS